MGVSELEQSSGPRTIDHLQCFLGKKYQFSKYISAEKKGSGKGMACDNLLETLQGKISFTSLKPFK